MSRYMGAHGPTVRSEQCIQSHPCQNCQKHCQYWDGYVVHRRYPISFGPKLIIIFNASKTSPEPHFDETALFPCFATLIPILANSRAVAVDIFNVFIPSPPVPQVSTQS